MLSSEKTSKFTPTFDRNATLRARNESDEFVLAKQEAEKKLAPTTISATSFARLEPPKPPEPSPPKPPPNSPFSRSPAWVQKAPPQQARRKMVSVSRTPSRRQLLRSNSVRSGCSTIFSKDTLNSFATGDEMVSMSDFSESYLEDDDDFELESVETEGLRSGIIAIGVISPPKPAPKTKEQKTQEHASKVVANDIAEKEHNLKMRRREVGERRLSAPCVVVSMVEAKRQARLSLTTHAQPRKSFLASLKDVCTPSIEEPTAGIMVTTNSTAQGGIDSRSLPSPPTSTSNMVMTPRLRARKSAGLSSMTPADRQEKVRAAMGAMGSARALPPPPSRSSYGSTAPPSMPVRRYSGSTDISEEVEFYTDEDDQLEGDARKPPGLGSEVSASSGLDLDDKTRHNIIAHSSFVHARRRRRSSHLDEKAMERESLRSGRTVASAASSLQSSEDFSLENTAEISAAASPKRRHCDDKRGSRISRASSSSASTHRVQRPCDEKASHRHNPSAARPCDEKAANRHNPSAAVRPGAVAVAHAPQETQKGRRPGLRLASGDARDQVEDEDEDALPFGPVTTSDLPLEMQDVDEDNDLEAQAGVPVVLPGAFAISGRDKMGQPISGYDSGFEENSVGSEAEFETPVQVGDPEEPDLRPVVSDNPVQAELFEELYAKAQTLDEKVEVEKDTKKRDRIIQVFFVFLLFVIAIGVTLAVLFSGKEQGTTCEEPCIPEVIGWSQVGGLLMGPTDSDDIQFGYSISMSGDGTRLAIGLPGLDGEDVGTFRTSDTGGVYIMDFNGTDWLTVQEIDGPGTGAEAGMSLVLSQDGRRVAIGAPKWQQGGYVAVYEDTLEGIWKLVGTVLTGEDRNGTAFGGCLGLSSDGTILAVGDQQASADENSTVVGAIQVFKLLNDKWSQLGDDIKGHEEGELFRRSLALSGDGQRIASSNYIAGEVRVFDFVDEIWVQTGQSLESESVREFAGASVALSNDGTTLAVGAKGYSNDGKAVGLGRVLAYQFDLDEDLWMPMGGPIEGSAMFDEFGTSVALSSIGDTLAIGSPNHDVFGDNAGSVQVMKFDGSSWNLIGSQLGSPETERGRFGFSVALSANATRVAGAAPLSNFDGFRSNIGQVWVYDALYGIDDLD
jgi:hypothetical protein